MQINEDVDMRLTALILPLACVLTVLGCGRSQEADDSRKKIDAAAKAKWEKRKELRDAEQNLMAGDAKIASAELDRRIDEWLHPEGDYVIVRHRHHHLADRHDPNLYVVPRRAQWSVRCGRDGIIVAVGNLFDLDISTTQPNTGTVRGGSTLEYIVSSARLDAEHCDNLAPGVGLSLSLVFNRLLPRLTISSFKWIG